MQVNANDNREEFEYHFCSFPNGDQYFIYLWSNHSVGAKKCIQKIEK